MSKPVVKAEEKPLKQREPPNMSVESERELIRRLRAKEDAAKPWYFTHV